MIGRYIHNYRIDELLGEGGMGAVYKATDTVLERSVALKMLKPQLLSQTSFLERFRSEAIALARLNHPNISALYNFIQDGGDYFMIMEYVPGESLEHILQRRGSIPPTIAIQIVSQALEGLQHAHQKGILHRDIKPANLMLTPEGVVKLMDFGIARIAGSQRLTQVNRLVGTLEYMAPEQVQGQEPSVQSDLYAMGILLYELLSGKVPFESQTDFDLMNQILKKKPDSLKTTVVDLPKQLDEVLSKTLNKKPEQRFESARIFQESLNQLTPYRSVIDLSFLREPTQIQKATVVQPKPTELKRKTTSLMETKIGTLLGGDGSFWQNIRREYLILGGALLLALVILIVGKTLQDDDTIEPVSSEPTTSIAVQQPQQEEVVSQENKQPPVNSTPTVSTIQPAPVQTEDSKSKKTKEEDKKKEEEKKKIPPNSEKPAENAQTPVQYVTRPKETPPETKKISEVPPPKNDPLPVDPEPKRTTNKSVDIRSGTELGLALQETLSSEDANIEGRRVTLRVTQSIVIDGQTVIVSGATAYGEVTSARASEGKKKGMLEIKIREVKAANGQRIPLKSATLRQEADSKGSPFSFQQGEVFYVRTAGATIYF